MPYNYDAATIEKFIMNGCKRGELSIRIDHATRSLTFETDLFAATKRAVAEGPKLQVRKYSQRYCIPPFSLFSAGCSLLFL